MSIFEQASFFTLDDKMKKLLTMCAKNRFPTQFKVARGSIVTSKGNTYPVPRDPIDLYNLVHDIMQGNEPTKKIVAPSTVRHHMGVNNDAIAAYADRHGRDRDHIEKIRACIYTALYMDMISPSDIHYDGDIIASIDGIDPKVPSIARK